MLLAAAVAFVAGCATAPSPAPQSRRFTTTDFFALDPATLRAAVLTDARVLFQAVVIDVQAATERFVFRLQQPVSFDPRLPAPPAGRAWQVYALAADQAAALATVRQLLRSRTGPQGDLKLSISAQPALVPGELIAALPLRIDMLVDQREGWFIQFDGTLDLRREAAPKS
jgi:hypothetical protein